MLPFRKISCVTFSSSPFVRVLRRTNSFESKTTVYNEFCLYMHFYQHINEYLI